MAKTRAAAKAPAPRIVSADEGFALGVWASVIIVVWRREVQRRPLQAVAGLVAELSLARTPFGVVTLIEPGVPLPSDASRAELARLLDQIPRSFDAVLSEDDGFYRAAVRGVVTGLALVTKGAVPSKIFGSITDAARWAVTNDPAAGPADELDLAIRTVRAALSVPHVAPVEGPKRPTPKETG